jgi:signal transduction histidine kinase
MNDSNTILIVDDEPAGREMLAGLLRAPEHDLAFAGSGSEALQQALDLRPDLILLDVIMAGMDGFEVCRRLRSDQSIGDVPIIMLTALDDRDSRIRGIEAGADDFVSKPFDRAELRARARTLMRLHRQRRLLAERDISERKQAELLDEERRRLAYELHDGLAQMVASTHQHLQSFAARHRPRAQPTRVELDRILDLAHRSAGEVRRVIAGLRPTALDDFGLAPALQMQVSALQAEEWDVSYQATLGAERLAPAIETVLYRVAQEALTNVRKHAQTTRVAVTLERNQNSVRLTIRDWGCGFEPAQTLANTGVGERIGLRGMHERVASLGGRWSVQTSPGAGVEITAEIPLA